MSEMTTITNTIPVMSYQSIAKVKALEALAQDLPQIEIETKHTFHAGLYGRTVMLPAGTVITGALIKIATVLIVSGEAMMFTGDGVIELKGYHVLAASAGRKQAFSALTDTWLTMLFATEAKTVAEAEAEFTDEIDLLLTNRGS